MNGTKCDTNESAGRLMSQTSAARRPAPNQSAALIQQPALKAHPSEPATHTNTKCQPQRHDKQPRARPRRLLLRSIQYQPLCSSPTQDQLHLRLEFRTLDNEHELQRFGVAAWRRKCAQQIGELDEFQVQVNKLSDAATPLDNDQNRKQGAQNLFRARLKSAKRPQTAAKSNSQLASEVALYLSPLRSLSEQGRRADVSTTSASELRLKFCHLKVDNDLGGINQRSADSCFEHSSGRRLTSSEQRITRLLVEESPRRHTKGQPREEARRAGDKRVESSVPSRAKRRASPCCCCCCCGCCGRTPTSLAAQAASSLAAAICLAHYYSAGQVARGQLMSERLSSSSSTSTNCSMAPVSCRSNSRSCSCSLVSDAVPTRTQPSCSDSRKESPATRRPRWPTARQSDARACSAKEDGESTSCCSSALTLANPNSWAEISACGSECTSSACSLASFAMAEGQSRGPPDSPRQRTNRQAQLRSRSGEPARQLRKGFDYSPLVGRVSISSSSSSCSISISISSSASSGQRASNPNALALSSERKHLRRASGRGASSGCKAERARKYAKRDRQDVDKSMATAQAGPVAAASGSCGLGASWPAPSGSQPGPTESDRSLADCLPAASNLWPSTKHADSPNIEPSDVTSEEPAASKPSCKLESALESCDSEHMPGQAVRQAAPRQHVAERPSQVDPKNLLNPMDLVFSRAIGTPHDHRAHSFTAATLSKDSDSLVAQLAAAARSRSLCTETDRQQLDARRFQQRRLDAAVKRVGDFGRRMSRMTRKAIDRLKVMSSSNPNLGPGEAGADCGAQLLKPAAIRRGRFNSQRVKGPASRRAVNYELELLVPGERAAEAVGKRSALFGRRYGNQATQDHKSASTLSLRMSQDEQQLFAPGGVYMGTGERCNLLELAHAGSGRPASGLQRRSAGSSRTNSISWLTRPLMRSSVAHALLGTTSLANSVEKADSDCASETATQSSSTPARRFDCASVRSSNVDNDKLRWNNNEPKGQLVVIRVGPASEGGQQEEEQQHDAVAAGALNHRASSDIGQVGSQIMKCDDQIQSDTSGPNLSATRHCLAKQKGGSSISGLAAPAGSPSGLHEPKFSAPPLDKQGESQQEEGEEEEEEEEEGEEKRPADERLGSRKTTTDLFVSAASITGEPASNLNRKQSLSAECDLTQVGGGQHPWNMSQTSEAAASKRWLLTFTHRSGNSNDKSATGNCNQQPIFRKQRECAGKIRSSSPPAHFSEENRSNSLSSGELHQHEHRLLVQLSRSTCAVNLGVAELAEQTSLYLAQLNDRFSSSSHELTLTPPSSAATVISQQQQHSTLWFRRSNSKLQPECAAEPLDCDTRQAATMQAASICVGGDQSRQQAVEQSGSGAATQLYGANLQTTCVHCQLIAELASHPESAYLSQLLASGANKSQLPASMRASREETPVLRFPAGVRIEPASDESDKRPGMRGPSLMLTACSNQGTFDEDEPAGSGGQSRRQSAGSTAILINLDGASTSETTCDSSSPDASRRSSTGSMGAPSQSTPANGAFQPLVEGKESKICAESDSEQEEDDNDEANENNMNNNVSSPSSGAESTSNGFDSSTAAQSLSVGHQAARRVQGAAAQLEAAPADKLDDCETARAMMNSPSGSSQSAASSSSASSLASSSDSDSQRPSRVRDDSKIYRRRKQKKRSVNFESSGGGGAEAAPISEPNASKEAPSKMNTLEVPLAGLANSKQMRSNSLDTHYLLKKGDESAGALSLSTSQNQSRELIDSDYEDYAPDDDYSKASSTAPTVAMALRQPSSAASTLLSVPVNKSARSRSVDISLPTQPGDSYGVRNTDTPSNRSVLQQQAAELKGAKIAGEKKSPRGKRFIQGEIKVPYLNGETRPLKLFVDWDENCVNGEHLWLYQGSSSEACYVGESECLKHGPRLSCSACKITAHTGCIGILTDKIKFICKHTFKDLTVNNPRHLKELHQNVIYHHWVHKRTHCGRCKQCTKTIGNTKLPFSSKEIQAITCSWCKVSYHNKENCYTLSTLTEPCSLGAHRESIIPPSWIVKLPAQSDAKSDGDYRNQLSDICDLNQAQQQQNSKLIDTSLCQTLSEQTCEFNNNEPKENIGPFKPRQQNQHSLGVSQQRYGSNATLITDTSGYMSADGCNSNTFIGVLHNNESANNGEVLMETSALHAADLSLINQAQGERLSEQALLEHHQDQQGATDQTSIRPDCDMIDSSYSLFEPAQANQLVTRKVQADANIFKNFKIIPQPIPGIPNAGTKPVLVFVNPRSGGNQGAKMMQKFNWLLNPRQVFDLIQSSGPRAALELYRDVPNLRILTIGGDGTASWILSHLDDIGVSNRIPVAVLPLGTGNDLARALGWGGGYADEPIAKILAQVRDGEVVQLDRWNLHVERNHEATPSSPSEYSNTSGVANMDFSLSPSITSSPSSNYGAISNTNTISSAISMLDQATNCDTNAMPSSVLDEAGNDRLPMDVINNYFSFGVDAHIALEFHTAREAHPERFNSRLRNKMFYGQAGGKDLLKRKWKDLSNFVTLYCDGQDMTSRLKELKVHSVLFLNIPSYGGGTRPWPTTATAFAKPRTDDGLIEVIGLTTYQLPLLQAGGHGTCIAQCRNAKIITSRTIPMQVDGEPCKLLPSIITISLKNRVCMLSKSKNSGHPQKLNQ